MPMCTVVVNGEKQVHGNKDLRNYPVESGGISNVLAYCMVVVADCLHDATIGPPACTMGSRCERVKYVDAVVIGHGGG